MTRVFLVDDHEIVRRGVAELLEREPDLVVVGEAGTVAQALPRIEATSPDVAILDMRLPDGDGIDLCRDIRSRHPEIACLILTAHDDVAPGKHRLYAYVLNLTARWRADWGGILMFLDEEDHVAEGYTPAFNALNIFRVPQRHAVSMVAPFAGEPRISITGWIRSEAPA